MSDNSIIHTETTRHNSWDNSLVPGKSTIQRQTTLNVTTVQCEII